MTVSWCARRTLHHFDARGIAHCRDPYSVIYQRGHLTFNLGDASSSLTVDGLTGRVALQ